MENTKDKLERIGELIGSGDVLERDLALELLREVYSAIKFGIPRSAAIEDPTPQTTWQGAEAVDETVLEGEDCQTVDLEDQPVIEDVPDVTLPPVIPRRVAPEVIRSLYGADADEEPEAVPEPEEEPEPLYEPLREPVAETASEPEPEPRPDPVPECKPEQRSASTLGDTMAAGHRTLGETLGNGRGDMASKIAAAERPGLKRSIGLNDRFLMIRDMFDGDAAAFDRAIARLDAFTDLDEAVIWIRENFDWSADSKGVALLIGLLERKLGH